MEQILLTNRIKKMVASLGEVKGRREHGCFMAEGSKCVIDTMDAFDCRYLLATRDWLASHCARPCNGDIIEVTAGDIARMSQLRTPQEVIAVYRIPPVEFDRSSLGTRLVLALDSVQDPGNLGTIVRVADWFGIDMILCSRTTADVYNPKVVQATMGAISRVRVVYCDLPSVIASVKDDVPVYGTFLDGGSIYDTELSQQGIIVMGNEGNGVSPEVGALVNRRLLIPSYPAGVPTSESLNVAMATGITLAEFRRRAI